MRRSQPILAILTAWLAIIIASARSAPAACPPAPEQVSAAISPTSCSVIIMWLPPASGILNGYEVLRGTTSNVAAAVSIGTTGQEGRSMNDSPPTIAGTSYYYWVRALSNITCPAGHGPEAGGNAQATVTFSSVPAPTNLSATPDCAQISVQWQPAPGASSYRVIAQTAAGATISDQNLTTTFAVFAASSGVLHNITVTSLNGCGAGGAAALNGISTLPGAPAPTGLAVTPGCNAMLAQWQAAPGAQSYTVTAALPNDPSPFSATTTSTTISIPGSSTAGTYTISVASNNACGPGPAASTNSSPAPAFQFSSPPPSTIATSGQPAALTATLSPAGQPSSIRWERDNQPLSDSARITGSASLSLAFSRVALDDVGAYRCFITTACGEVASPPAVLAVRVPCRADFNFSGGVSVQDIFDFLTAYFSGCP